MIWHSFYGTGDLVSLEVVTASNGCPGLFRQLNADDAFISMTARMIKALNQQNHADLLSTFGLLKEKDEFALEAFSPAARLAIVRLLKPSMQINTCINLLEANYSRI